MNHKEYIEFCKKIDKKRMEITLRKNKDYSGTDGSAFKNFEATEFFGITSTLKGMLVRMSDKFMRMCVLIKEDRDPAVKDESLEDTILDMMNYCCLMLGKIESTREEKEDISFLSCESFIDSTTFVNTENFSLTAPPEMSLDNVKITPQYLPDFIKE